MIVDILILIWLHFIADFIFQYDKMAINKSSSNKWLGFHVFIYSMPFIYFGWMFWLVNLVGHFVTDWISSRLAKKAWEAEQRHTFFVIIGADQAVHMTTLVLTYWWLVI